MHSDSSIRSIASALPAPFLLIAAPADGVAARAAEASFRRMGLRPEPIAQPGGRSDVPAASYRLHFGNVSAFAGLAPADALDLADPLDPATSLLAASLPPDWRHSQQIWKLTPVGVGDAVEPERLAVRLREFFKLVVLLIDLFDAAHIFWSPARLWSDAVQFRQAVAEMGASGMPPVLHLVAFRSAEAPDGRIVGTRGLALFGGQEIEGRMPASWTVADMVKRLARLALDIILNGAVREERGVRGLEAGEWISLTPLSDADGSQSVVQVEFGNRH